MSIAACSKCGHLVDTDFDCEFFDYSDRTISGYDGHCEQCRGAFDGSGLEKAEATLQNLKSVLDDRTYKAMQQQFDELADHINMHSQAKALEAENGKS